MWPFTISRMCAVPVPHLSGYMSGLFPVVKMESSHELLPDPYPINFRSFNLVLGRGPYGGDTVRPVEY